MNGKNLTTTYWIEMEDLGLLICIPLPPADTCLMFLPTAAALPPLLPRARVMPAILRGEGGWNGQARGKINSFPSDADGLGEVSIYVRPGAGFKSWDGDLRQSAQICFN